ncbi:hypothetical protein LOK49_LG13G01922 [Camellia lanceoleosa]|uniref:Uncharacterized protein n=1 Tax=Camellia lanceoleosa TaxID=1840588 RepID=A0ACC0FK26_9ERIC|nr:hypothetical protein LOK49_LG13G01922 [Camellia lanceoleosa]
MLQLISQLPKLKLTSPEAGIIQKFVATEGDTFERGTNIAVISKSGEGVTHVAPSATIAEPTPSEKKANKANLMKLRSDYKDVFVEKHGVKLGLMSGFVKATVSGLQNQPIVNAVIDGDDDIIYRDNIDISIAIGTSKHLNNNQRFLMGG